MNGPPARRFAFAASWLSACVAALAGACLVGGGHGTARAVLADLGMYGSACLPAVAAYLTGRGPRVAVPVAASGLLALALSPLASEWAFNVDASTMRGQDLAGRLDRPPSEVEIQVTDGRAMVPENARCDAVCMALMATRGVEDVRMSRAASRFRPANHVVYTPRGRPDCEAEFSNVKPRVRSEGMPSLDDCIVAEPQATWSAKVLVARTLADRGWASAWSFLYVPVAMVRYEVYGADGDRWKPVSRATMVRSWTLDVPLAYGRAGWRGSFRTYGRTDMQSGLGDPLGYGLATPVN